MKQITKIYGRYRKYIENIMFPMILLIYPLLKIDQGIDVSDTTYSLANYQYFGSMEGTWMVATFLANAVGSLLMHLPWGLNSELRCLTPPLNLPAPGRRQPISLTFRFRIDLCFC